MAYLLPILLIAKAQRDRRNEEARRRRAETERRARKRRQAEKNKKNQGQYKRYDNKEYIYKLVSEDEFLVKFFDEVDKKAAEIEAKENHQDLLEIQDLLQDSLEKYKKIQEKANELVNLGVSLSNETYINCGAVGVKTTIGCGFGGVGTYGYKHVNIPVVFNGINVTREHLSNPNVNPYEEGYRNSRAAKEDLLAEIERIEKEIKRKEFFLKISPFGRENIEYDIVRLNSNLTKTKRDIEIAKCRKEEMDTYAALTPQQKAKIGEYYDVIDEYKTNGVYLLQRIDENINKSQRYYKYESCLQTRWCEAVRQLVEVGIFTEEDVKLAEEKLAAMEIPEERENIGISEMTFRNGRRDYAKMVDYFYNRPQIAEKRKELAEKRAKLSELKKESKVIIETEVLVKDLSKDKTKKIDEEQK